jgi:hypothetical protein
MHVSDTVSGVCVHLSFDIFTSGQGYVGDDNPSAGGFFLKRAIVALNLFFAVRVQLWRD